MQKPLQVLDIPQVFETWQILGPFPTGSREQDFGADPLEAYGGIHNLSYSTVSRYPSELVDGGSVVGWQLLEAKGTAVGPLEFPSVRWSMNQLSAGWSINQYQAWAVTSFRLEKPARFRVQFYSIGDFYINHVRYSGDWYNYRTTAHVVSLSAGQHTLRIRVVNDIRIFGGSTPPKSSFEYMWDPIANDVPAVAIEEQLNIPDVVDGRFTGDLCSIGIQNVMENHAIQVVAIDITHKDSEVSIEATLIQQSSDMTTVMPGQIRQIPFLINATEAIPVQQPTILGIHVTVSVNGQEHRLPRAIFWIQHKNIDKEAFRITFEDADGSVQYAMVKSPRTLSLEPSTPPPILVALHGAGVTTSWPWWTDALSSSERAWTVYPTGRTSWGYDWHGASMINVFMAVDALVRDVPKLLSDKGQVVMGDPSKLIYIGHSNGGQGAWYLGTHYPDKAVAIFAAAGYTKIQDYVPYGNWLSISHSDPWIRGILESSIAEYNNDLHASNLAGIPIYALTGGNDDNVPPLHTRKYARLASEYACDPEFVKVFEHPGQGHWWDTILNNSDYSEFIEKHVDNPKNVIDNLTSFTVTVMNPSGSGSKGGITIEQLLTPYHLGRIDVKIEKVGKKHSTLYLSTTNVKRFRLADQVVKKTEHITIYVDDMLVIGEGFGQSSEDIVLLRKEANDWQVSTTDIVDLHERNFKNYGPLHRIYETSGPLTIVTPPGSVLHYHKALQIAHDWNMYGNGDSRIIQEAELADLPDSNIIFLGGPDENKLTAAFLEFAISDVSISSREFNIAGHRYSAKGTGIIFHQPWRQRHMAIVIAGIDEDGFSTATQLIPKRTGIMVSDWVVTGSAMKWKGIGGILAAGYFDNGWKAFGYF